MEELDNKQAAKHDRDDRVTDLFDGLACLATLEEPENKVKLDPRQYLRKRLQHVEHNLWKVATAASTAAEQAEMDYHLQEQYDEQVNEI